MNNVVEASLKSSIYQVDTGYQVQVDTIFNNIYVLCQIYFVQNLEMPKCQLVSLIEYFTSFFSLSSVSL